MFYNSIYTYINSKIKSINESIELLKNEIESILKEELKEYGIRLSIDCMEMKVYLYVWSEKGKKYGKDNNILLEDVLNKVFGIDYLSYLKIIVPENIWISKEESERIAERFI